MKKQSYLFSTSNLLFSIIYVVGFIFSLFSLLITSDEYYGGNRVAEFGTSLINFYLFPVFLILKMIHLSFSSQYDWLALIIFIIAIVINYLLTSFIIHLLLTWIKRDFRKSH